VLGGGMRDTYDAFLTSKKKTVFETSKSSVSGELTGDNFDELSNRLLQEHTAWQKSERNKKVWTAAATVAGGVVAGRYADQVIGGASDLLGVHKPSVPTGYGADAERIEEAVKQPAPQAGHGIDQPQTPEYGAENFQREDQLNTGEALREELARPQEEQPPKSSSESSAREDQLNTARDRAPGDYQAEQQKSEQPPIVHEGPEVYEVQKGDNLWNLYKERYAYMLSHIPEHKQNAFLDSLLDRLEGDESLRSGVGVEVGVPLVIDEVEVTRPNISKIWPGEKFNLGAMDDVANKLFEDYSSAAVGAENFDVPPFTESVVPEQNPEIMTEGEYNPEGSGAFTPDVDPTMEYPPDPYGERAPQFQNASFDSGKLDNVTSEDTSPIEATPVATLSPEVLKVTRKAWIEGIQGKPDGIFSRLISGGHGNAYEALKDMPVRKILSLNGELLDSTRTEVLAQQGVDEEGYESWVRNITSWQFVDNIPPTETETLGKYLDRVIETKFAGQPAPQVA
jgi:hypothetical protein